MKQPAKNVFKFIDMLGGPDACWPWRGRISVKKNGVKRPSFWLDKRNVTAYRLVYELVHGVTLEPSQMLLHSCDNELCCNPRHLRIGDHAQNMEEMSKRDRHGLPTVVVRAIKKLHLEGVSNADIAERYGIAASTVVGIISGRRRAQAADNE